jgi:hypothetical protein
MAVLLVPTACTTFEASKDAFSISTIPSAEHGRWAQLMFSLLEHRGRTPGFSETYPPSILLPQQVIPSESGGIGWFSADGGYDYTVGRLFVRANFGGVPFVAFRIPREGTMLRLHDLSRNDGPAMRAGLDLEVAVTPWTSEARTTLAEILEPVGARKPVGLVVIDDWRGGDPYPPYWALAVDHGTDLSIIPQSDSKVAGDVAGAFFPLVLQGRVVAQEYAGARLRSARAAVGWNGEYVFLIATEGSLPLVKPGATTIELATLAQRLGALDAINLDGGGSAYVGVRGRDPAVFPRWIALQRRPGPIRLIVDR